jgi:hypothetical protein
MSDSQQALPRSAQLNTHLEFLDEQIQFHTAKAKEFSKNAKRAAKHLETAEGDKSLKDFLIQIYSELMAGAVVVPYKPRFDKDSTFALSMKEIADLPQELKDELSVKVDGPEFVVLEALEKFGGAASLDQILVAVFRKTNEIHKRTAMTNRLYRMVQKEEIYSVPGRKGVYSLFPIEPSDLPSQGSLIPESESATGDH